MIIEQKSLILLKDEQIRRSFFCSQSTDMDTLSSTIEKYDDEERYVQLNVRLVLCDETLLIFLLMFFSSVEISPTLSFVFNLCFYIFLSFF